MFFYFWSHWSRSPMFDAAHEFQINGGTFIGISGDMNIHSAQSQPTIGLGGPLKTLESGPNASTGRWVGAQRNGQQRMVPSGILLPTSLTWLLTSTIAGLVCRPLLLGRSYESCNQLLPSATIRLIPGSPPIHPGCRAIEHSSTHDQDRGRSPQGYVSGPELDARDHRTHINIAGNVNQIQHHGKRGECSTYAGPP